MPATTSSSALAQGATVRRRGLSHYLAMVVVLCLTASFFGLTAGAAQAEVTPEPAATDTATPSPEEPVAAAEPTPSKTANPLADGARAAYLVTFADGTTAAQRTSLLDDVAAADVNQIPQLGIASASLTSAAVDALRADPSVVRVEADAVREVQGTPNDPAYDGQWALPKIGWDQAFGSVEPAGRATVAVLDTGVDVTDDLAGHVVDGASMLQGIEGTADPNGHGTAMASIVAAGVDNGTGIAGVGYQGVSVLPVKVLGADGTGQDSDIVAGVVYAADHGADVILMSFANPGRSSALQAAVDYAWSKGAVIVAATGNDGSTTATYPAGLAKVVGVSATTRDDALWSGSNSGDDAFLGAPGVDVAAGAGAVTGTSASAAVVAGSAALVKADHPDVSNGVIVGRLARTADPAGSVSDTGNGRVNLARALADDSTDPVVPQGVSGSGGPVVGPYRAASNATITGTVRSTAAGSPAIPGATVSCESGCNGVYSTTANTSGAYTLDVGYSGSALVTITAAASGYKTSKFDFSLPNGNAGTRTHDFSLEPTVTTTSTALARTTGTASVVYGTALTYTATVSPSPAGGGTVTFKSGATTLCADVALSGNTATCSPPRLRVGSYDVVATYNGTSAFSSSTSTVVAQTVTAKPVTGSFTAANKVYDGTTDATITDRSVTGVLAGDEVSLSGGSASFGTKGIGTDKTVTGIGFTLGGAQAGNYTLTDSTLTTKASITALSVTGHFTAADKEYDGTTTATINGRSLVGIADGDHVSLTGGTASFGSKDVGAGKIVTGIGFSLGGDDADNYALESTTLTTTAAVTKRELVFKADDKTRVYGEDNPEFTGDISGVQHGDVVTLSFTSSATATSGVGSYAIVPHAEADEAVLANYTLRPTSGSLEVTKAPLIVTVDADDLFPGAQAFTKVYGQPNPRFGVSYSGFVLDQGPTDLTGSLAYDTDANALSDVGSYDVTPGGLSSANYDITFVSGALDVTRKALTITVDANTNTAAVDHFAKVYGSANPSFSVRYAGFVDGEGPDVLDGTLAYATDADAASGVGSYDVTPSGLSSHNYDITFVPGTLDVTPKALTITADANTNTAAVDHFAKVYGSANPSFSVRYAGFVDAEGPDVLEGTLAYATDADAESGVGSYGVTPSGLSSHNYDITFVPGTLDVTPKSLSITANPQSKSYGEALDLGTSEFTVHDGDLEPGDSVRAVTLSSEGAAADAPVIEGGYPILASDAVGTGLANYTISYHAGILTLARKALSITAKNQTKTYGDSLDLGTEEFDVGDGLKPGDSVTSVTLSSDGAAADAPVVEAGYPIVASDAVGHGLGNYAISYHDGRLTVTPKELTGSFTARDKVYDGNTDASVTDRHLAGVVDGDVVTLTGGTASFDTKDVGSDKTVTLSGAALDGADKGNYTLGSVGTTTADIGRKQLTGTFTAANKVYDGSDSAEVTDRDLTGVVAGDEVALDGGTAAFDNKNAGTNKTVTLTGSDLSGDDRGNYYLGSVATTTANIEARPVTIKADDHTKQYGDSVTFQGSEYSLESGSIVAGEGPLSVALTSEGASSGATVQGGPYAIVPSSARLANGLAANYDITWEDGTLTVTRRSLAIKADDKTKILGAANPEFTGSMVGVQNGDDITLSFTSAADTSSPVGSYPIVPHANGTDAVLGNYDVAATNGTLKVFFGWDGFLQPVNDTAHQTGVQESKFKLGQTIPVKFDLKNVSGQVVNQSGNPTFTRSAYRGTCDSNTTVESLPTIAADGSGVFAYTSGHYQYNWSTKGISQAGEYRVYANLADGTAKYVDICLTK